MIHADIQSAVAAERRRTLLAEAGRWRLNARARRRRPAPEASPRAGLRLRRRRAPVTP
jgi:hypothetical protein